MLENFKLKLMKSEKNQFKKNEILHMIDSVSNERYIESMGVLLDTFNMWVEYRSEKIKLPNKEFLLLKFLIQNKNRILTRQEILDSVWGTDVIVEHRTVDVHLSKIKKKIPTNSIISKKYIGYAWEEK
jgi:DNA-binding response OmpR family regulator